jgi:hypothetical protein
MQPRKLLPYAIFLLAVTSAQTAFADISIGAEAGGIYTLRKSRSPDDRIGFGFAGRLGYDLDLSIIHLIPEIKVAYDRMPLEGQTNVLRGMGGLRATIGIAFLALVGYAHVGYGAPVGDHAEQLDYSGLIYEFGGGIDFTTIPIIDIGIWAGWSQVRSSDFYDWLGFGVSLTITI